MKISDDQNTITLDDGSVFVAIGISTLVCEGCEFLNNRKSCTATYAPCSKEMRKDCRDVIFIKGPK